MKPERLAEIKKWHGETANLGCEEWDIVRELLEHIEELIRRLNDD